MSTTEDTSSRIKNKAAIIMGSENITVDGRAVLTAPDMNYELRRLETFRFWPSDAPVDPQRIAKAGFYSTGNELEVKCFSCGRCISEWEYNDQVMAKHRILSPECAFVKNPLECENVPLLPPVGSQADYKKEEERLASYRRWNSPHVTPRSLARNGLYYTGESDRVACAFCSVELHEWQAGDDPLQEHRRASPNCPLLFGYAVGNVPLDHTGSGIIEGEEASQNEVPDVPPRSSGSPDNSPEEPVEIRPFSHYEGTMTSNKNLATNPQFGAQAHRPPIHTRYQTYESRLASFSNWPPGATPTPEALADAGFFYQGMLDHACCFHCNGGLHNWDPADDPWEEHARWFSRCPFVGIIKGREFIQRAISKKPPIMPISQISEIMSNAESSSVDIPQISVEPSHNDVNGRQTEQRTEDVTGIWQQNPEPQPAVTRNSPTMVATTSIEPAQPAAQEVAPQAAARRAVSATATSVLPELKNLSLDTQDKKTKQASEPENLAEENRKLQEARLCKVCLDEDVGVVFLPCGHLITCVKCAPNLAHCPMCRERIQATVRTYFS